MTNLQILDNCYGNKLNDPSESRNKSFLIKYIITFQNIILFIRSTSTMEWNLLSKYLILVT